VPRPTAKRPELRAVPAIGERQRRKLASDKQGAGATGAGSLAFEHTKDGSLS
jgi:hypothetical protein